MRPMFLLRLGLDLIAAALLIVALAYDWLGNMTHEIAGTAMFLLLISHNIFNRRWYTALSQGWHAPPSAFSRSITLTLLVSMLVLLVTSVIISRSLFSFLPLPNYFIISQVHASVAYIVLFIASLHIGLQWRTVMRALRNAAGIRSDSALRSYLLRTLTLAVGAYGAYSLTIIDVRSKLVMELSLSFWDFETATLAFFLHIGAIITLFASMSHYALRLFSQLKSRKRPTDRRPTDI